MPTPTVGAPLAGYYFDAATNQLRPLVQGGPPGPQGPAGPTGPAGPPGGAAGQADNISLSGTNITVPAVGWQKVPLNTQNVGFNWDNTNKRWTCPTTGAYNISGVCSFTMTAAQNSRVIVSIWVNGVERTRGTDYTAGTTNSTGAGGIAYCDTYLFAGDYVELYSYSNPVKALEWVGGTTNSNMLTVRLLAGVGPQGPAGPIGPQGPAGGYLVVADNAELNALPKTAGLPIWVTATACWWVWSGVAYELVDIPRFTSQAAADNAFALITMHKAQPYYLMSNTVTEGPLWRNSNNTYTRPWNMPWGFIAKSTGTANGSTLSTTPFAVLALNNIALKRNRQYVFSGSIRAVSANSNTSVRATISGVTPPNSLPNSDLVLDHYVSVVASILGGVVVRQPFTVSADGTFTIGLSLAVSAGAGNFWTDGGSNITVEDCGPVGVPL
jgi:hypothetical protein